MTGMKLIHTKDASGRAIRGLWENEIVRLEAEQGGWRCQVPVREIGKTGYFEYRPLNRGGAWCTIGWRRTRDAGVYAAEKLRAGSHVLKPAHSSGGDRVPVQLLEWVSVSLEITEHSSVKNSG